MEGKVAVLGTDDFVKPFAAMGLDTFAVSENAQQVIQTAQVILKQRYVLVVVAETVAAFAAPVFEQVQRQAIPCVVVVPFTSEPTGIAIESLGKMLKIATGINILAN